MKQTDKSIHLHNKPIAITLTTTTEGKKKQQRQLKGQRYSIEKVGKNW